MPGVKHPKTQSAGVKAFGDDAPEQGREGRRLVLLLILRCAAAAARKDEGNVAKYLMISQPS